MITVSPTTITAFCPAAFVCGAESLFLQDNIPHAMEKAEKKITTLSTICEYNRARGVETFNPLVSVIDFSKCSPMYHSRQVFGFYAVFLKEVKCGDIVYGRQNYDYQEGTIVAIAPGQVVGFVDTGQVFQPKGWALLFHPDLIHGSSLGRAMKDYTFFSYESNEALHLSEREREIVVDCLQKIKYEVERPVDRHSRRLINVNIEMLLDYCLRFYERQFITRTHVNHDILLRFEQLLDDYFAGGKAAKGGLPTVRFCAEQLCLSPNYFGDLLKKETGKSAQEHIQLRLVREAKERILLPDKTVGEVAYELGFQHPQHFTRLFKKVTGTTPTEWRKHAN